MSNIIYSVADNHKMKAYYVSKALDARLYVNKEGFELKNWMEHLLDEFYDSGNHLENIHVALATEMESFVGCTFVGIAIFDVADNTETMYVKPSHRKMGIGKHLLTLLPNRDTIIAEEGIKGSLTFYKKCGIKINEEE